MLLHALFLAVAVASPATFFGSASSLPKPLSDEHISDIGCVATLAIIADDQRRGAALSLRFPYIVERGAKYAGIVGQQVVDQTGQPKEVVALAIRQAVQDQRAMLNQADAARTEKQPGAKGEAAKLDALARPCLVRLGEAVPAKPPTADDYLFCAAIIRITAEDIESRDGKDNVNAQAMRGLYRQLAGKYQMAVFPPAAPQPKLSAEQWAVNSIDREVARQRKLAGQKSRDEAPSLAINAGRMQRCVFLGD